jgi:acyl-CoA thioester hydrolase
MKATVRSALDGPGSIEWIVGTVGEFAPAGPSAFTARRLDSGPMGRFEIDVAVRYRDLDTYGHVNNAVYLTYCETARVEFLRELFDRSFDDLDVGFVVAHAEIDYRQSIGDVERVPVRIGVEHVGTTSFTLSYDLRVDGETAATAESVQVVVDQETRAAEPVPDRWREAFAAYTVDDDPVDDDPADD